MIYSVEFQLEFRIKHGLKIGYLKYIKYILNVIFFFLSLHQFNEA